MAKSHLFLAALTLAALTLGAALPTAAQAQDTTAATVVAKVNGVEITLGHMIAARAALPDQYKSLPNETLFTGILDQLIQQTALEQTIADKIKMADQLQLDNARRFALALDVFPRLLAVESRIATTAWAHAAHPDSCIILP
jgi:peptidyl-prolyl cis-trans isomerase C